MAEADNALREEIEKVRERARLQALAQGIGPEAAAQQGNQAVEEFCARWGIRPDMIGTAPARGFRPAPAAPAPAREEARKVDLGASPLRNAASPGQTQAIRIADLLKRSKEAEPVAARPSPAPAVPPSEPNPNPNRTNTNLSALLQRMRTADPSRPIPAPVRAPTAVTSAAPPAFKPPATSPRPITAGEPLGAGGTLTSNAERRRQVLEEFDRTYAEVQAMLEQRIGVVDIALNDASTGISGVMAKAKAGGLQPHEIETLAGDVDRLRSHLTVMMQLCDEFLQHMNQIHDKRGGGA